MNIAERLDRLPMTPLMWKVLMITGIGWLFDAMDQGMVAGVLASIDVWDLSKTQLTILTSTGVVGMALGAAFSGIAADRWGRRTVIVATLLIFSFGSFMCGISQSYEMLLVCRFITGLGLGGELPVASTLVSEFSPRKSRGRNVVILESFWAWGWIAAAFVAYLAIPVWGWRVAFIIGAVPALFAAILRFLVPESPRYLDTNGKTDEADALVSQMESQAKIEPLSAADKVVGVLIPKLSLLKSFGSLWSKPYIRSTAVLWVLWFGINLGYYGFVLWTPTLLMDQGFTLVKSFQFVLIMCIAQLPGYALAAILIEKIGRKLVLILFFTGTALSAWLFGHAGTEFQVLATGCLIYFFALGAWGCVYSYTPELYPTKIRGAGVGWAAAFGRLGALIGPFLVPALYKLFGAEMGFTYVFILLTAVFILVAIVVAVFGKETKNVQID